MTDAGSFHAHVYFDASSIGQAKILCEKAKGLFPIELGRYHERPIGPHPMGSCQLAFGHSVFGEIIPWLALNRAGLTIFIHPETGDEIKDHTEHAIWMGAIMEIDISVLK